MRRVSVVILFALLFAVVSADAALYKGQRFYITKCKPCHGLGQVFIVSKRQAVWDRMMQNGGKELMNYHLENEEAKETWDYFRSDAWKRHHKHLREFMIEYAADSGNIPACN